MKELNEYLLLLLVQYDIMMMMAYWARAIAFI